MHALVLLQNASAAVDTVAVVKLVHDLFGHLLPGLPDGFVAWMTMMVLGAPVLAAVFSTEWVGALVLRLVPALGLFLAPHWARYKGIINPILAALFAGGLFHNPLVGLGAGVLWGMVNSVLKGFGKPTAAGLLKAKSVVLVLGSLLALALAGPSMAAEKQHYGVLALERFSLSPGTGYRWEKSLGNATAIPYWDVQLGYAPWDRVKLTGRLGHNLGPLGGGQTFGEARVGLVF